jgi:uncharacterized protein (DUF433 family)
MFDWQAEIYNLPAYPVSDAARYLRIPTVTMRSWVNGRACGTKDGKQHFEPLIKRPTAAPELSFTNLIEAHILRVLRETHQVRLDKVRSALDYLSQQLGTEHPLIQSDFQTDGIDLFINSMDRLVNVSRAGQLAMRDVLSALLDRVEWDEQGFATRLFPFISSAGSHSKILSIDPRVAFGKPTIVGTGIPTASIVQLYEAGEDIDDIADEFDCTSTQISAAIQFESLSLAA